MQPADSESGGSKIMNNAVVSMEDMLDVEWISLLMSARKMGFSVDEVRGMLKELQESDHGWDIGGAAV